MIPNRTPCASACAVVSVNPCSATFRLAPSSRVLRPVRVVPRFLPVGCSRSFSLIGAFIPIKRRHCALPHDKTCSSPPPPGLSMNNYIVRFFPFPPRFTQVIPTFSLVFLLRWSVGRLCLPFAGIPWCEGFFPLTGVLPSFPFSNRLLFCEQHRRGNHSPHVVFMAKPACLQVCFPGSPIPSHPHTGGDISLLSFFFFFPRANLTPLIENM